MLLRSSANVKSLKNGLSVFSPIQQKLILIELIRNFAMLWLRSLSLEIVCYA